jgi:HSP20 family protein
MRAYFNTFDNPWRLFDELMGDLPLETFNAAWRNRAGSYPRVNVWEGQNALVVEAEVAGVNPDKMEVSVDSNVLTLKGERERAGGGAAEFQRSFSLPFELDEAGIKAAAKNGILTVTIPRRAAPEKRKIAIEKL